MITAEHEQHEILKMFGLLFNNNKDSDYVIKDEQQNQLFLHKIILMNSYKFFGTLFSNEWKKETELVVKNIKPYKCVMEYFYTKEINFQKYSFDFKELNELIVYSEGIFLLSDDLNFLNNLEQFIINFLPNQTFDSELLNNLFNLILLKKSQEEQKSCDLLKSLEKYILKIDFENSNDISFELYQLIKEYLNLDQRSYYSFLIIDNNPEEINEIDPKNISQQLKKNPNQNFFNLFYKIYGSDKSKYFFDERFIILKNYPLYAKIFIGDINFLKNTNKGFFINNIQYDLKKGDMILIDENYFKIIKLKYSSADFKDKFIFSFDIQNIASIGMNINITIDNEINKITSNRKCYLIIQ